MHLPIYIHGGICKVGVSKKAKKKEKDDDGGGEKEKKR